MTCPRCFAELLAGPASCPECGVRLLRKVSGVVKTSTVLIAAGGGRGCYRSMREVPEPLRTRLIEATSGDNAGTIVIADRAGKERIGQTAARRRALTDTATDGGQSKTGRLLDARVLPWAGALLLLIAAAILAFLFFST